MMIVMEEAAEAGNTVLVGVKFDCYGRELLNWALVKVAEPGDHVIAVHVCRHAGLALKNKPLLDGFLDVYDGLCKINQVNLTGEVVIGNSIKKVLVREAKKCSASTVIVGLIMPNALGSWTSVAKYCARHLASTTQVMAIHNGKVVFHRNSSDQSGMRRGLKAGLHTISGGQSEFGDSRADTERPSFESIRSVNYRGKSGSVDLKDPASLVHGLKIASTRSVSFPAGKLRQERPGWPLLRPSIINPPPQAPILKKMSVVQWVMSLPDRSPPETPQSSNASETPSNSISDISDLDSPSPRSVLHRKLGLLLKSNSSLLKWFTYDDLMNATAQFCSDNLIGKGGCNHVYKGFLSDGKPVAVKILNSSKEARKEFALEVDIVSSLSHNNITPLIGVCDDDDSLISVYNFFSKGSLEENLHGDQNVLSWDARFRIAVSCAEALNYLHSRSPRPVIHRDVKSSNILLSDGFEPQLSDFGLAIWGPTMSSFLTQVDVVGTFGYIAPEYFMYGKVSDKIDVYSFGVVLLELISGRKPICSETLKGQESLVVWAKPLLDSGDINTLLDPKLECITDDAQLRRMVLAAKLCLTRAARLRPRMSKILELLKEEKDFEKVVDYHVEGLENLASQDDSNDDEVYPESCAESHISLALLDVNDDSRSLRNVVKGNNLLIEEYLQGRFSRSVSNLD